MIFTYHTFTNYQPDHPHNISHRCIVNVSALSHLRRLVGSTIWNEISPLFEPKASSQLIDVHIHCATKKISINSSMYFIKLQRASCALFSRHRSPSHHPHHYWTDGNCKYFFADLQRYEDRCNNIIRMRSARSSHIRLSLSLSLSRMTFPMLPCVRRICFVRPFLWRPSHLPSYEP